MIGPVASSTSSSTAIRRRQGPVDRSSGPVGDLAARVPSRARAVDQYALYELITVVGGRPFSATTDERTGELGLVERSLELVRLAGLHFATVTWSVDEQGAEPARLDADADASDLRYVGRG